MNKQTLILILSFFFIAACSVKKNTTANITAPPKSAKALISRIEANNKSPEWLSLKGKISLDKDVQEINFSTNIRIRKDSIIWMSIRAPFGIELFRTLLTPDSIFFMNIPKSTFIKQPISYLHKQLKTEINFLQIQQMFFGAPSILKAKYSFSEEEKYAIFAKDKKIGKITYFVEKENFRIIKGEYFKTKNEYFKFSLSDYTTNNGFLIPKSLMLDVMVSDNFLAELNYSKITANKVLKMGFSIPKNYVEIK